MEKQMQTASKKLSNSRTKIEAIAKKIPIYKNLFHKYKEITDTYISRGYVKKISKGELTGPTKNLVLAASSSVSPTKAWKSKGSILRIGFV